MDADGSDVTVATDGGPVRFRLKAPGRHMAMNALAAIGAANATVSPSWPRLTQPSTPDSPSADGRIKSRRHADKAAPEQNTPPPLVGGGSGEGVEQEDVCVSTPPPAPPTRGGVFLGSAQRPYPDAYGDNPRRDASVVHALGTFAPVSGRGARRPIALPGGTALLLDESYNGNGASMRAALEVLPAATRAAPHRGARRHAGARRRRPRGARGAGNRGRHRRGPGVRLRPPDAPPVRRAAIRIAAVLTRPIQPHSRHWSSDAVAPGDAILVKGSLGSRMRRVVEALDAAATHTAEEAA